MRSTHLCKSCISCSFKHSSKMVDHHKHLSVGCQFVLVHFCFNVCLLCMYVLHCIIYFYTNAHNVPGVHLSLLLLLLLSLERILVLLCDFMKKKYSKLSLGNNYNTNGGNCKCSGWEKIKEIKLWLYNILLFNSIFKQKHYTHLKFIWNEIKNLHHDIELFVKIYLE